MRYILPLASGYMDEAARMRCEEAIRRARIVSEYAEVSIVLCGGKCNGVANLPPLSVQMQSYIRRYLPDFPIVCNESENVLDLYNQITCAQRILALFDPRPRIDFMVDKGDVHRVRDILTRFPNIHPGCICPTGGKSRPYTVRSSWSWTIFPHSRFLSRA